MRDGKSLRARELAIGPIAALAMFVAIASSGCAELATLAPALRIDALATRSTTVRWDEVGERESWSWGIGASLIAAVDRPPVAVATERAPAPAVIVAAPCRIEAVCAWERAERASALRSIRDDEEQER